MIIALFLALATALFQNALLPNVALIAFAPFLALGCLRYGLVTALWLALGVGLIMDLFTSEFRFGFFALSYSLAVFLTYGQRRHFFEEKWLSLALLTLIFSFFCTLIQWALISACRQAIPISWHWIGSDLIAMPLLDAFYAFIWFTCPLKCIHMIKKWRRRLARGDEC